MNEMQESITFITPSKAQIGADRLASLPPVGSGFYSDDALFYRVEDLWFNASEATGAAPYGWNVKLRLADPTDHPPRDFDPSYYRD